MIKTCVCKQNPYLNNAGIRPVKLHNLHWSVAGKDLKAVRRYPVLLHDMLSIIADRLSSRCKTTWLLRVR